MPELTVPIRIPASLKREAKIVSSMEDESLTELAARAITAELHRLSKLRKRKAARP